MNIARFARFLIVVGSLFLVLALAGVCEVEAQTILNPSFESPGGFSAPSNWSLWIGAGSNSDNLESDPSPGVPYQGSACLAVKGMTNLGNSKGGYQYVSSGWTSGHIYRLSVYCKNLSNTGINYAIGYTQGNSTDGSTATYGSDVVHPSTWTQATVQFTYSGASGVTIFLKAVNDGNFQRAGFDLVEVTDLSGGGATSTPTNTPVGPTPTRTNTPAGPTFTPTRTPTSGIPTSTPSGITKWLLTYGRQCGQFHTAGNGPLAEVFATQENGGLTQTGITNRYNSGTAIFGYTNPGSDPFTPGNRRIYFNPGVTTYDFQVYDPGVATDGSVDCYWDSPLPDPEHNYRFEFHFRKVSNNAIVTMYPYNPVYHFDLVNTFNTATTVPANYNSDNYALTEYAAWHAQTFVVPANMNRIIEAKAFAITASEKFFMKFSILQGGHTGTQVGPSVVSREVNAGEYDQVMVAWGLNDIPVTPGGTYALKVERCNSSGTVDPTGFNMYATTANNYANGSLRNSINDYPAKDMVAVVVGAFYGAGAPTPTPTTAVATSTPTRTPTVPAGNLLGNWSFEQSSGTSHPSWSNASNYYGTNGAFPDPINAKDGSKWASYSYGDGPAVTRDLYQTISVTAGRTYHLAAWAYLGGNNGSATARLVWANGAYPGTSGGTSLGSITWTYPAGQITWTEISGQVVPTGSSLTFIIRTEITGFGGGINWDAGSAVDQGVTSTATPTASPTRTPTSAVSTATPTRTPTQGPSPTPFPTQSNVSRNLWLYY